MTNLITGVTTNLPTNIVSQVISPPITNELNTYCNRAYLEFTQYCPYWENLQNNNYGKGNVLISFEKINTDGSITGLGSYLSSAFNPGNSNWHLFTHNMEIGIFDNLLPGETMQVRFAVYKDPGLPIYFQDMTIVLYHV